MDYKTLSAVLGHYSVAFTMDTYVHSMDEHKRKGMDKMDDLFGMNLEISVEQQPYPVLFTMTSQGCSAFRQTSPNCKSMQTLWTAPCPLPNSRSRKPFASSNILQSPLARRKSSFLKTVC